MKKVMLILIIAFLLVSIAFVYAKQGNENQNQNCTDSDGGKNYYVSSGFRNPCPGAICGIFGEYCDGARLHEEWCQNGLYEGEYYICPHGCSDGACISEDENEETIVTINKTKGNKTTFLPWQKRNESECPDGCSCHGAVTSCETENGKIMTIEAGRSGNIITITVNKKEVNTSLEIESENNTTTNKTKIKAKLSNGRKAEIKIMPDTASEKAIERLGQLNFTIQLKEVGKGNNTQLAYELQAERHYRILILFKAKALVKAEIDAETGEIIIIKKPWWAFLAKED